MRKDIEAILQEKARAPWGGLIGEKLVNVLEVNLELHKKIRRPGLSLQASAGIGRSARGQGGDARRLSHGRASPSPDVKPRNDRTDRIDRR